MSQEPPGEPNVPRWVPIVLNAAAVYNLAWGAFIVLFPTLPFRWIGMPIPNYPAIVQCLGMVVGVYGVGYALAARDPVTLWPLVFVGLLGKILGPIGFVYAASMGEFPWLAGITIITNDLSWWLPFTAILLHAARVIDARKSQAEGSLVEVLKEARTQKGESLLDLSQRQELLLVCIRHSGCTYCREALSDLSRQRQVIEERGLKPIVIHMGSQEQGAAVLSRFGCDGIDQVSDPERRVYRALELRLGTLSELFGFKPLWRALVGGTIYRYGFGQIVGNALQLAGAFVVHDGKIVKAFRHKSTADRTDLNELACSVATVKAG